MSLVAAATRFPVQLEADRKWWPVAPARQPRLKGIVYVVGGTVARIPTRDEIAPIVNEQLIVELYSR